MRTLSENNKRHLKCRGSGGDLEEFSPKFCAILHNIQDENKTGLHLVYSQFRTLQGIGIFELVLQAKGFTRFDIEWISDGDFNIDVEADIWADHSKPLYALYTGKEDVKKREIIRKIYNGEWSKFSQAIKDKLNVRSGKDKNNMYGKIIKVFMVTSSGSEGINLRNTRYVHIMEPYWNPIRIEQVIGRASRICSHQAIRKGDPELPGDKQTVEVFMYVMKFTQAQIEANPTLMADERGGHDEQPITTDQYLLELSNRKKRIGNQLLTAVKETSIDCTIHNKDAKKEEDKLQCFAFQHTNDSAKFSYTPNYKQEDDTTTTTTTTVPGYRTITTKDGHYYAHIIKKGERNYELDYDKGAFADTALTKKVGKFVKNKKNDQWEIKGII
jgi:hypothetical protein